MPPISPAPSVRTPNTPLNVLIVDDMEVVRDMLTAVLEPLGHKLSFAKDGQEGLGIYKSGEFDLVLCDIDMKPMDGLTMLKHVRALNPQAMVVMMTAFTSTDTAIKALKHGAFDYLGKPYKIDELLSAFRRCAEALMAQEKRAHQGSSSAPAAVATASEDAILQGGNPKTKRLVAHLRKLATATTPVLISGEPGSGHEEVARALHSMGANAKGPLVVVDCRHVTEDQLRAGLLGDTAAYPAQAAGGSLVILSPHAMPADVQEGFVSVLRKAGGSFRLISATEEDLDALAMDGRFSDELYYRIAVLPVELPPLRDRLDDLPMLVKSLTAQGANPHFDAHKIEFSEPALRAFAGYAWPGNYAELKQVVLQAVSSTDSRLVDLEVLPDRFQQSVDCLPLADYLQMQERQYLSRALQRFDGDVERAARAIGVDPSRFLASA